MCLGTFLRLRRSLATPTLYAAVRILAERFYILGKSTFLIYKKAGCLKTANLLGSFFPILSPLTYNKYRNPRIYIK